MRTVLVVVVYVMLCDCVVEMFAYKDENTATRAYKQLVKDYEKEPLYSVRKKVVSLLGE